MRPDRFVVFVAATVLAGSAAPGMAQQQSDPCAPGNRLQAAPSQGTVQAPGTQEQLSDRLAQTGGVLCPPDVGTDMRAPTPPSGTMPVIPPPGTPGGDQSVQPK